MQMTNYLNINTIKSKLKVLKAKMEGANKYESKLTMYVFGLALEMVACCDSEYLWIMSSHITVNYASHVLSCPFFWSQMSF